MKEKVYSAEKKKKKGRRREYETPPGQNMKKIGNFSKKPLHRLKSPQGMFNLLLGHLFEL
jgi:hypothetical protein